MARKVDEGEKAGTVLGSWICSNCGAETVVRERSKWSIPAKTPDERCSCNGCCFDMSGPHGTMTYRPAPSNVIPFRR